MGPMGQMDSTSAGCQMQWHAALTEPASVVDTSCVAAAAPLAPVAATTTRSTIGVQLLAVYEPVGAVVVPIRAARSSSVAVACASARYILFRDFRI
jgi:hypothetical protein